MTERGFPIALALAAAGGALIPRQCWPLALAAVSAALFLRRAGRVAAACVAIAAAASSLSAGAWAGLDAELPESAWGRARLVTDPAVEYGAVRMQVDLGGRRYDAWAREAGSGQLMLLAAGEEVELRGRTASLKGRAAPHLRRRHVAGRLEVEAVGPAAPGPRVSRVANGVRRILERGAAHLPDPIRGLFGGFVLGDDRGQDEATVDKFREAGLTHLMVVSGQNVAFVLALAAPLVARGGIGSRLVWTGIVLVAFGTMVRWEPSVLRAVAMAGLAAGHRGLGRPSDRLSSLAWAVTVILLVDPLLAGSVSFILSVSASLGIAVVAPWLATRLRGPRPLTEALAATVGAQVAVAPVLISVFGSVSLASLPANLLAAPAAAPAMTWGMAAGVPAGLLGEPAARWLHLPTRALLWWVDAVAGWAASLGSGG